METFLLVENSNTMTLCCVFLCLYPGLSLNASQMLLYLLCHWSSGQETVTRQENTTHVASILVLLYFLLSLSSVYGNNSTQLGT